MKSDIYLKGVLTVIAVLLLVLAIRPVTPIVHAAEAVTYEYSWVLSKDFLHGLDKDGFDGDMETLNKLAKQGAEVIAVVPLAGKRNDNIASGTGNILYVLRYPRSVSASQKKN